MLKSLVKMFPSLKRTRKPATKAARRSFKPRLDALEDRQLMAVLLPVVTQGGTILNITTSGPSGQAEVHSRQDTTTGIFYVYVDDLGTNNTNEDFKFPAARLTSITFNAAGSQSSEFRNNTTLTSTATGTSGIDKFQGGSGDDTFFGMAGADIYRFVFGGKDTIVESGIGGDVTLDFSGLGHNVLAFSGATMDLAVTGFQPVASWALSGPPDVKVNLSVNFIDNRVGAKGEFVTVIGTDVGDILRGNSLSNTLRGEGGNDVLEGRGSGGSITRDILIGGSGSDTYVFMNRSLGTAQVREAGFSDVDTLDFSGLGAGVVIDLSAGTTQVMPGLLRLELTDPNRAPSITSIENVIGSKFADRITGNALFNVLTGGEGNDVLTARGARGPGDVLIGGIGFDTLVSGPGDDRLIGGAGNDTYSFGGVNTLLGIDKIIEDDAVDTDTLDFSQFRPVTLDLRKTSVQAVGTVGIFSTLYLELSGSRAIENVIGSRFRDVIFGNDRNNVILGGDGNDELWGMNGADSLFGQAGDDFLCGGNHFHNGGPADNQVDILRGGKGHDHFKQELRWRNGIPEGVDNLDRVPWTWGAPREDWDEISY